MSTFAPEPRFSPDPARRLTPSARTAETDRPRGVRLLRVDDELRAAVPDAEVSLVDRVAVALLQTADAGRWSPDTLLPDARSPFAAMLIDGVVTRQVRIASRATTQLLGPGDVFDPWGGGHAGLPSTVTWQIEEPARFAVLDDRFTAATARCPQLGLVIQKRLAAQVDRLALHCAVTALPRVEQRVLALFWLLAERWGRVGTDGVLVPLRLTHAAIGALVGAQRPTVTLALRDLARAGSLIRADQSSWLLAPGSEHTLAEVADGHGA